MMIHYNLHCANDHNFDGWFRDSASFDKQALAGLVVCPECADTEVRRAMMAPALGRRANQLARATPEPEIIPPTAPAPAAPQIPAPTAIAAGTLPDQLRAMLQRMRAEVEKTCEHVGDRFADEARAIHNGETEARAIYGETTPAEAEALAEDGIEVARIPWLPRADG